MVEFKQDLQKRGAIFADSEKSKIHLLGSTDEDVHFGDFNGTVFE